MDWGGQPGAPWVACSPRCWLNVRWFPDKQRALSQTAAWRLQTSTTPQRVRPQSSDDRAEGLRTKAVSSASEPGARFLVAVDTQPPRTALDAWGPLQLLPRGVLPGALREPFRWSHGRALEMIRQHVSSRLLSGNPPSKEHAGPSLLQRPHLPSARSRGHGAQPQLRQAPRASREALAGAKGPGLCSRRTQAAEPDGAVPAPRLCSQRSG